METTKTSSSTCKNLSTLSNSKILDLSKVLMDKVLYKSLGISTKIENMVLKSIFGSKRVIHCIHLVQAAIRNMTSRRQATINKRFKAEYYYGKYKGYSLQKYLREISKAAKTYKPIISIPVEKLQPETVEETSATPKIEVATTVATQVEETSASVQEATTCKVVCTRVCCNGQDFDTVEDLQKHMYNVHCVGAQEEETSALTQQKATSCIKGEETRATGAKRQHISAIASQVATPLSKRERVPNRSPTGRHTSAFNKVPTLPEKTLPVKPKCVPPSLPPSRPLPPLPAAPTYTLPYELPDITQNEFDEEDDWSDDIDSLPTILYNPVPEPSIEPPYHIIEEYKRDVMEQMMSAGCQNAKDVISDQYNGALVLDPESDLVAASENVQVIDVLVDDFSMNVEPIIAPPVIFASQEARTEVRRSRMPTHPLPPLPSTIERHQEVDISNLTGSSTMYSTVIDGPLFPNGLMDMLEKEIDVQAVVAKKIKEEDRRTKHKNKSKRKEPRKSKKKPPSIEDQISPLSPEHSEHKEEEEFDPFRSPPGDILMPLAREEEEKEEKKKKKKVMKAEAEPILEKRREDKDEGGGSLCRSLTREPVNHNYACYLLSRITKLDKDTRSIVKQFLIGSKWNIKYQKAIQTITQGTIVATDMLSDRMKFKIITPSYASEQFVKAANKAIRNYINPCFQEESYPLCEEDQDELCFWNMLCGIYEPSDYVKEYKRITYYRNILNQSRDCIIDKPTFKFTPDMENEWYNDATYSIQKGRDGSLPNGDLDFDSRHELKEWLFKNDKWELSESEEDEEDEEDDEDLPAENKPNTFSSTFHSKIILGNLEQYMDENNLNSQDFQEDKEEEETLTKSRESQDKEEKTFINKLTKKIIKAAAEPKMERKYWDDEDIIGGATFPNRAKIERFLDRNVVWNNDQFYVTYVQNLSDQDVPVEEILRKVINIKNVRNQQDAERQRIQRELEIEQKQQIQEAEEKARDRYGDLVRGSFSRTNDQTFHFSRKSSERNQVVRSFHYNFRNHNINDENELERILNAIHQDITQRMAITGLPYRYWQINSQYTWSGGTTIGTTVRGTFESARDLFVQQYIDKVQRYPDRGVVIEEIRVNIYLTPMIASGATNLDGDFEGDENWSLICPTTKTNCMYTAFGISYMWLGDNSFVINKQKQKGYSADLKYRAGCVNKRFSSEEDIKIVSDYKQVSIAIYKDRNLTVPYKIIGSYTEQVPIYLENNHFQAMLSRKNLKAFNIKLPKKKPINLNVPIKTLKDTLQYKPRRMLAYDIETFNREIEPGCNNQVPYTIGWAFEVENIGEWTYLEYECGYEVIEADLGFEKIHIAYKKLIGTDCLTKFLNELKLPLLNDSVCYGHNAGKFDIRVIMEHSNILSRDDFEIKPNGQVDLNGRLIQINGMFKDESSITRIKKRDKNGKERTEVKYHQITFRDTYPIFQGKLEDMAKELKVPHQKLVGTVSYNDYKEDNWQRLMEEEKVETYLKHDVLGLLECLIVQNQSIHETYDLHITQILTAASLADKVFFKDYYDPKSVDEEIYLLDQIQDEFCRAAYCGGRVENFVSKEINDKIYYYDRTSLYPYEATFDLPSGKPKWILKDRAEGTEEKENIERNDGLINRLFNYRINKRPKDHKCFIWYVYIRNKGAAQGHPIQNRKPVAGLKMNFRYLFQWYASWTPIHLCEIELLECLDQDLDYEFKPINGIEFDAYPLFRECVLKLFKAKQDATANEQPSLAQQAKIVINSLTGFPGLKTRDREALNITTIENSTWAMDLQRGKLLDMVEQGNHVMVRRLQDIEGKRCNVSISAWITARSRINMYRVMRKIEQQGGTIYYMDTDSVMTDYKIEGSCLEEELMGPGLGANLGELKNEAVAKYKKHIIKQRKNNPEYSCEIKDYFQRGIFVNPKTYYLEPADPFIKPSKGCKGWHEDPDRPDTLLNWAKYEQMLNDPKGASCTNKQFQASDRNLMNGVGVNITEVERTFTKKITKGTEITGSGTVLPFIYGDARTDPLFQEED